MSDENIWGEEENFNDMPDEAKLDENGRPKQAPPVVVTGIPKTPRPAAPQQSAVEEVEGLQGETEEVAETEEDVEDILSDAQLRLEQGSLYKMIMNHNLFEGVDADPRAIQVVQREIRQVAQEKMEIMLGMRQERAVAENPDFKFPFNSLEVEVLKQLVFTATKGASEHAEDFVPGSQEVAPPKRQFLKPIGGAPAARRAAPPTQPKKPLTKKAAAPVQRTRLQKTIEQIAREEGVPVELLELNAPGLGGKSLKELTPEELAARNKIAAQRRDTQVRSTDALPMATPEQQAEMAIQRATYMQKASPLMTKIIEAAKVMPASKILNPGEE